MKIGLLADIHEHVEHLTSALQLLERQQVDRFIVLGDICMTGTRLRETVTPLIRNEAIGVWGNHELGLCHNPDPKLTSKYDDVTIEYLSRLKPELELGEVLFTHGMPNWDATDPTEYYTGKGPMDPVALSDVFSTHPHWLFLMGHFHHWFAANEQGSYPWNGEDPIQLRDRHLMVVNPVFQGSCAVLDTDNRIIIPHNFG